MFNSIEFPTNEVTVTPQAKKKNDRSFHMDRGKIVCNGCGGHFPNLVLFENHTHKDGSLEANMPSKKSGPKTAHRTFNNFSQEEMMEAFHKMPELKGCYYKNGSYVCCMCGKCFSNPYVLFSHRIIHPPDMKPIVPRSAPPVRIKRPRTEKVVKPKPERHKVVVPTVYENESSGDESDTSDDDSSNLGLPSVTKAVMKSQDGVDEALPITFGESQEMVQVPWVPVDELIKRNPGQGSRTYIYKMQGKRAERSTYVNIHKPKFNQDNVVVVTPKQASQPTEKVVEKHTTNPGNEKGLVFTDLDEEKMKKAFNTLPGLQKCKVLKDGKFQCDRCFRVCDNPYLLFSHRLTHMDVLNEQVSQSASDDVPKTGSETKLVFYSLPGLNKCKMVNGQYYCDHCPEKFGNPYLLFTHKMSHENVDDAEKSEPKVIEIQENSAFGNIFGSNGLSHCKIAKGKYFCDKCTRSFSNPYLLLNHKLVHENVETTSSSVQTEDDSDEDADDEQNADAGDDICYECNLCQVQFEDLDGLASHIEAHTRDADTTNSEKVKAEGTVSEADNQQAKADNMPAKADNMPAKADNMSTKADNTQAKADNTQAKADNTQANADNTLAEAENMLAKADNTQAKADNMLAKADNMPTKADNRLAKADNRLTEADGTVSEEQAGPSGQNRKRDSTNRASSSADDISSASEPKIIKKEPVRIYPGEKTAVQSESPQSKQRIKVRVELVQPSSDNSVVVKTNSGIVKKEIKVENSFLNVKMPSRRLLKRAVVRLERLNIKPNQFCILR